MNFVLLFENWVGENEEQTHDQIEQGDLVLSSKSQYFYRSRTPDFSAECSGEQGINKKADFSEWPLHAFFRRFLNY